MTEVLSPQDYPHIPENKKWQQRELSLVIFVARRKKNYLVENPTTDVEFGVPSHYIDSNAIEAKLTTITPEALCDG